MHKHSDVIIIGGGVVGCAAAYYLAKRGVYATVLDAKEIGSGASSANVGGVRQTCRGPVERPLGLLATETIWPHLEEELDFDLEYKRSGRLIVFNDEYNEKIAQDMTAQDAEAGLDMRMVYGHDLRAINPYVAPGVYGAAYCVNDGHANPMRTTLAFYIRAQQMGAKFYRGQKVLSLKMSKGKLSQVITETDVFETERVILAAGFASREIMRSVGIDIPMLSSWAQLAVTEPLPPMFDMYFCVSNGCFQCQQHKNGQIVFGADGTYDMYDATYARAEVHDFSGPYFSRCIQEFLTGFEKVKVLRSWSGMLDMSWDAAFTISPVEEVPGLVVACGFTGHGFGISPATGYVLSQLAIGEKTRGSH